MDAVYFENYNAKVAYMRFKRRRVEKSVAEIKEFLIATDFNADEPKAFIAGFIAGKCAGTGEPSPYKTM